MKTILERENNCDKVQDCHSKKSSDFITDVSDGYEYKNLRKPGGFLCLPTNNVTFTFFTDGIPLFKSSKFHFGLYIWLSTSYLQMSAFYAKT